MRCRRKNLAHAQRIRTRKRPKGGTPLRYGSRSRSARKVRDGSP